MHGLLLYLTMTLPAAPAPAPAPKKVAPPITAADLHRVGVLHWSGKSWWIGFDRDGQYWCHRLEDGRGSLWHGPWRLESAPDGPTVVIEERLSYVSPDAPPEDSGTTGTVRLRLRRVGKELAGHGWGAEFRLE